jgi:inorganic pyrophosphatase
VRDRFGLFTALLCIYACSGGPASSYELPPAPAGLAARARASIDAARPFAEHPWRDTPATNDDGTVNGYVEIPRGASTKWEFRIDLNRREVDRTIPPELGGYPINYGFLPQTISYDGDPADVLVLGPPLEGGTVVGGRVVALMEMIDSGDIDHKVVISPLDGSGGAAYRLEPTERARLSRFFSTYKRHEGKVTSVPGWGDESAARGFLRQVSGFFAASAGR